MNWHSKRGLHLLLAGRDAEIQRLQETVDRQARVVKDQASNRAALEAEVIRLRREVEILTTRLRLSQCRVSKLRQALEAVTAQRETPEETALLEALDPDNERRS